MEKSAMTMPANYAVVSQNEMVYLDGGVDFSSVSNAIVTGAVNFWNGITYSVKSLARSFVEVNLDDLRNPNFQAAAALVGTLAIISVLMEVKKD